MRRLVALLLLAPAGVAAPRGEDAPAAARPNVVVLIADDLGPRLGCYGDALARTPRIDRLAGEGVLFTRAYCQGTTCNPSRTSFLSGQRPPSTGIFENRRWSELDLVFLPEHFARHGYDAVKVGKVFHPERKQRVFASRARAREGNPKRRRMWTASLDTDDEVAAAEGQDAAVARSAARFLESERERPFVLAVGFSKPHLPFDAPERWFELHRAEDMVLPEVPDDDLDDLPGAALQGLRSAEKPPEEWRAFVRGYYACVSYVDACVGTVLDALDRSGRRDDTVVVLMSDHGMFLGEHDLWRKGALLEGCLRVPLLVSAPGRERGKRCARLVENVDLLATLSELCGIPAPPEQEGTSFVPLLAEPERPWKRAAFSYEPNGTTIRTERWRFTEWSGGGAEVYDHASDPEEHTNVARSGEHAATVEELRSLLRAGWTAAVPEPDDG